VLCEACLLLNTFQLSSQDKLKGKSVLCGFLDSGTEALPPVWVLLEAVFLRARHGFLSLLT